MFTSSRPKRKISSTATAAYMIHSKIPLPSFHYCWSLLVIHTADVLFGGTKKPPSKECWCVGRHTDDFDWLIFDWFNHVDYTLSYYYIASPSSTYNRPHHIQACRMRGLFHSLQLHHWHPLCRKDFGDIQTRWDTALFCSAAPRPAAHNTHVGGDEATAVQHY